MLAKPHQELNCCFPGWSLNNRTQEFSNQPVTLRDRGLMLWPCKLGSQLQGLTNQTLQITLTKRCAVSTQREAWSGLIWRCGLDCIGFPAFSWISMGCQLWIQAQAHTIYIGTEVAPFSSSVWRVLPGEVKLLRCFLEYAEHSFLKCGRATDFPLVSLQKGKKKRTSLSPPTKRQYSLNLAPSTAHSFCALPNVVNLPGQAQMLPLRFRGWVLSASRDTMLLSATEEALEYSCWDIWKRAWFSNEWVVKWVPRLPRRPQGCLVFPNVNCICLLHIKAEVTPKPINPSNFCKILTPRDSEERRRLWRDSYVSDSLWAKKNCSIWHPVKIIPGSVFLLVFVISRPLKKIDFWFSEGVSISKALWELS